MGSGPPHTAIPGVVARYCDWGLRLLAASMGRISWGEGPPYQGMFQSFVIKSDNHCLIVRHYIERNPLRADVASKGQDWVWSSLGQYFAG